MPKPDVKYAVWVQPMRGRPVKTDTSIGPPIPGTFRFEGKTYFYSYQDDIHGYLVYNETKPIPQS